jgi:hypothetical protein
VASARRALDLEVWAQGYRPERLLSVRADQRVVLEPGLALRVRLLKDGAPLPKLQAAWVQLAHGRQDGDEHLRPLWTQRDQWQSLDGNGEAQLSVPVAGMYSAQAWAWIEQREYEMYGPAGSGSSWEVAVQERGSQLILLDARDAPKPQAGGG